MKVKHPIYHITTEQEWEIYQLTEEIAPDSLFSEGFIHCSNAEQVPDTIDRFFSEEEQVIILELTRETFGASLKDEPSQNHGTFPHIYRAIQLNEVVSVHKQSV